jgi:hypothetical protein
MQNLLYQRVISHPCLRKLDGGEQTVQMPLACRVLGWSRITLRLREKMPWWIVVMVRTEAQMMSGSEEEGRKEEILTSTLPMLRARPSARIKQRT